MFYNSEKENRGQWFEKALCRKICLKSEFNDTKQNYYWTAILRGKIK